MKKINYILMWFLLVLSTSGIQAQLTFDQVLAHFPEYSLPLDPQSIELPNETLSITVFNSLFTDFAIDYPYILLDDGKKAHAATTDVIEDEIYEYSPGEYDTTKVYPLGRVALHPDYYSLFFCISNMEYDLTYIYNFDAAGKIHSGLALTVKSNFSPTYYSAIEEYSLIQSDGTILTKSLGETEMHRTTFEVRQDGIFQMLTHQTKETSDSNNWGTDERRNDLDQFARDGIPTLTGN